MRIKGYVSPLSGVIVRECASPRTVASPAYTGEDFCVSKDEFSLEAREIGRFYARGGSEVEYSVYPGADEGWVRLYLNGQVTVALLHQRGIITFHASSFVHAGRGVMVLGESGAGKSSLTASFSLGGAGFLTDDVTPVQFQDSQPVIRSLQESIRIRKNTVEQLNVSSELLREAETGTGKQYVNVGRVGDGAFPLGVILTIEIGDVRKPVFDDPSPAKKFALLRSEICMSEILAGMPETEAAYLQQLVQMIEQVPFVRVVRPEEIRIAKLHEAVELYLGGITGHEGGRERIL